MMTDQEEVLVTSEVKVVVKTLEVVAVAQATVTPLSNSVSSCRVPRAKAQMSTHQTHMMPITSAVLVSVPSPQMMLVQVLW